MTARTDWQDFGLPPGVDGHDVLSATASRNGTRTATTAQRRRWWRRRQPQAAAAAEGPRGPLAA